MDKIVIRWSEELSVDVKKIDDQHKKLFSIINKLSTIYRQGDDKIIMLEIINELLKYSIEHFNEEYSYMAENDYPLFNTHKNAHQDFIDELKKIILGFEQGRETLTKEMLIFLGDWWINHISKSDTEYARWIKNYH